MAAEISDEGLRLHKFETFDVALKLSRAKRFEESR